MVWVHHPIGPDEIVEGRPQGDITSAFIGVTSRNTPAGIGVRIRIHGSPGCDHEAAWLFDKGKCVLNITVLPIPSNDTVAPVVTDGISTSRPVLAGVGRALVDIGLALVAFVPNRARTAVGIDIIGTCAAVLARIGRAIVDVGLAVVALVAGKTGTSEGIDAIDACAFILARIGRALVDIGLTCGARIACIGAIARVAIDTIDACTLVLARDRGTVVEVVLAVGAREARRARARVAGAVVGARSAIETRIRVTGIRIYGLVVAGNVSPDVVDLPSIVGLSIANRLAVVIVVGIGVAIDASAAGSGNAVALVRSATVGQDAPESSGRVPIAVVVVGAATGIFGPLVVVEAHVVTDFF